MISDELLVERAQRGDTVATDAILSRFESVCMWIAADYYDPAADRDDLRQEARIGVVKAIRDYNPEAGASFRGFAFLCIRRNVMTAVKTSTRGKHNVLTFAGRVATDEHGDEVGAAESLPDSSADVVSMLHERDQVRTVVRAITERLSPLEREAIVGFAFLGESYQETDARLLAAASRMEIAEAFHSKSKLVDNALQRARRKIALALAEADARPLDVAA